MSVNNKVIRHEIATKKIFVSNTIIKRKNKMKTSELLKTDYSLFRFVACRSKEFDINLRQPSRQDYRDIIETCQEYKELMSYSN